jgi:hypothetical protein
MIRQREDSWMAVYIAPWQAEKPLPIPLYKASLEHGNPLLQRGPDEGNDEGT